MSMKSLRDSYSSTSSREEVELWSLVECFGMLSRELRRSFLMCPDLEARDLLRRRKFQTSTKSARNQVENSSGDDALDLKTQAWKPSEKKGNNTYLPLFRNSSLKIGKELPLNSSFWEPNGLWKKWFQLDHFTTFSNFFICT